ncbi:DUF6916 family protein [Pseudophaeobacter leonis]|uniref:DUF6916 family protein n=1 Tax=Pseudophaeobacter leonis TaxID=1144477 RepID=UPI0009F53770|nr:hypothetical protein [Pseudophaeobacter leonis]
MFDLKDATAEQFAEFEGQEFLVKTQDAAMSLRLLEVKGMGASARDGGAFSLLWQGPAAPALRQEIHLISHAGAGEHEVFLVPVAQAQAGIQYEAVFT